MTDGNLCTTVYWSFSTWTRVIWFRLSCLPPLVDNLSMQTKTFHILFNTIPPWYVCLLPASLFSIWFNQYHMFSMSTLSGLPFLTTRLTSFYANSSLSSTFSLLSATYPPDHDFSSVQRYFLLTFIDPNWQHDWQCTRQIYFPEIWCKRKMTELVSEYANVPTNALE